MPTPTYTALANTTLASAGTTITFSSISQDYEDLILIINGSFASDASYSFRFNSDTGSNYFSVYAQAVHGGTITSSTFTTTSMVLWAANNVLANTNFTNIAQVMDYSITNKHKTVLNRNGGRQSASDYVSMAAGRWGNTSAITSITIIGTANFNIGTTFSLYGIAA
jgi:hypothetical protein